MFKSLSKLLKAETPFALVTIIEGTNKGAKLLVQPLDKPLEGTLGNESLDRVVARDALGELAAGRSGVRHYGLHGKPEKKLSKFLLNLLLHHHRCSFLEQLILREHW